MRLIHSSHHSTLSGGQTPPSWSSYDAERTDPVLTIEVAKRNNEALLRKATGRYYTPEAIGRPLASAVAENLLERHTPARVVDPFSGDGRLIVWFLQQAAAKLAARKVMIEVWDVDGEAVATAVERIEAEARRLGLQLTVVGRCTDAFQQALSRRAEFDVVITNPPWERLKPDPRDLDGLNPSARDAYVNALRTADRQLGDSWPTSQPTRKWGGWGTNLSRVGIEVSHWLCRDLGAIGIVVPSSFLADSTSTRLRRLLLSESTLHHVAFYPAEMRVWDDADIDCVTVTASKRPTATHSFVLEQTDRATDRASRGRVSLSTQWLDEHEWAVPVTVPPQSLRIIQSMSNLRRLGHTVIDRAHIQLGRELDETDHKKWTTHEGSVPFIKGRDIAFMSVSPPRLYLADPTRASTHASTRYSRFIWRDVTRPSQSRRLVPAVLPPGAVTGNSVGVGWVDTEESCLWAHAIAGLMASVVLEAQARALLATTHMSKGVVSRLRLPNGWPSMAEKLAGLATGLGAKPSPSYAQLEVEIAHMLDLDLDSWSAMADAVPAVTDEIRQMVASQW